MKREMLFQMDNIVSLNDRLWYIAPWFSHVMEVDIKSGEIKSLFVLNENMDTGLDYRSLLLYNNCLWAFPTTTNRIIIYKIDDGAFEYRHIPPNIFEVEERNWSARYIKLDNFILFYWANPIIVLYNLADDRWTVFRNLNIKPYIEEYGVPFVNDAFVRENSIYVVLNNNEVIELLCETGEVKIRNICDIFELESSERVWKIKNINDEYIIGVESKEGKRYLRLYNKCKVNLLEVSIEKYEISREYLFIRCDKGIIMLPGEGEKCLYWDLEANNIYEKLDIPVVSNEKLKGDWRNTFNYNAYTVIDDKCYCVHPWSESLVRIDLRNEEITKKGIWSKIGMEELFVRLRNINSTIITEDMLGIDLKDWIKYI